MAIAQDQVGLDTGHEDADNFLAFSGGHLGETEDYIAWKQGPLRIGKVGYEKQKKEIIKKIGELE